MKTSEGNRTTAGGDTGTMEAFLRCTVLRHVCVVMECSNRARNDDGAGEKGDHNKGKVLELARVGKDNSQWEVGGRWRLSLCNYGREDRLRGLRCR